MKHAAMSLPNLAKETMVSGKMTSTSRWHGVSFDLLVSRRAKGWEIVYSGSLGCFYGTQAKKV